MLGTDVGAQRQVIEMINPTTTVPVQLAFLIYSICISSVYYDVIHAINGLGIVIRIPDVGAVPSRRRNKQKTNKL